MSFAEDRPQDAVVHVAICISTFRRPQSLSRLLRSLAKLRFDRLAAPAITVIVVDNDSSATASPVIERWRPEFPWALVYDIEGERNISLARNRGVRTAMRVGADFLAFIDDDEVARPDWLLRLLECQAWTGAEVVGGAVIPMYEDGVPDWVVAGGFFEIPGAPQGASVEMAHTCNALVMTRALDNLEHPFDPRFGRSGGEDSHFFMRMRASGSRIVWAGDARTEEHIPATRATARWILLRAFRVGAATAACERSLMPARQWLVPRFMKGVGRAVEGSLLLLPSVFAGRHAVVASARKIAHGAGCVAGILGYQYLEYETVHGS